MKKPIKLTPAMLRGLVVEAMKGFGDATDPESEAKKTDEVEADELADTLEKKIDYAKALKVESLRLHKRLARINEERAKVLRSLKKNS